MRLRKKGLDNWGREGVGPTKIYEGGSVEIRIYLHVLY